MWLICAVLDWLLLTRSQLWASKILICLLYHRILRTLSFWSWAFRVIEVSLALWSWTFWQGRSPNSCFDHCDFDCCLCCPGPLLRRHWQNLARRSRRLRTKTDYSQSEVKNLKRLVHMLEYLEPPPISEHEKIGVELKHTQSDNLLKRRIHDAENTSKHTDYRH